MGAQPPSIQLWAGGPLGHGHAAPPSYTLSPKGGVGQWVTTRKGTSRLPPRGLDLVVRNSLTLGGPGMQQQKWNQ